MLCKSLCYRPKEKACSLERSKALRAQHKFFTWMKMSLLSSYFHGNCLTGGRVSFLKCWKAPSSVALTSVSHCSRHPRISPATARAPRCVSCYLQGHLWCVLECFLRFLSLSLYLLLVRSFHCKTVWRKRVLQLLPLPNVSVETRWR